MRGLAGDRGGAAQAAQQAVAVQEGLVAASPEVPRHRLRLVRALLAGWRWGVAAEHEREALHARALALAEALHRDHPEVPDHAKVFADLLVDVGLQARQRGDRDLARHSIARAVDIAAAAVARDPRAGELRDAHAYALRFAAEEAHVDGDATGALALVERGLAELRPGLEQEPRHLSRRRFLRSLLDVRAHVQVETGDHEGAARTLAERAACCDSADDCYAVARAAARAARTAQGTPRDALLDRALSLLQESIRLGFADAQRLEADADLAELRADPRFEEVRRALAAR
jgi:hypothetical protein